MDEGRMIWEGPNDQGDSPAQKHQPDNKLMKNGIDILLFCMGCTFTLAASAAFLDIGLPGFAERTVN